MGVGSEDDDERWSSHHGREMFSLRFNMSSSFMKSTLDCCGGAPDFRVMRLLGNDQGNGFHSSASASSSSSSSRLLIIVAFPSESEVGATTTTPSSPYVLLSSFLSSVVVVIIIRLLDGKSPRSCWSSDDSSSVFIFVVDDSAKSLRNWSDNTTAVANSASMSS